MKRKSSDTAIIIGVVCIATYLTNYYMRHILSILTPRLLETVRQGTVLCLVPSAFVPFSLCFVYKVKKRIMAPFNGGAIIIL